MKADDMNPFIDDLFAEARTEAPVHSFANTKKTLLAGLAIGGAGLLGAKFITSSILKTKFFIMSISTVAIITSAALVYTAGLKPTEFMSEAKVPTQTTYAVVSPEPNEVPDNLFIAADFEPDDTVIVVKKDSIVDVEDMVREIIERLDIDNIEGNIEEMIESMTEIEINTDWDDFEDSMEELAESFEDFEVEFDEADIEDFKKLMVDFSIDSLQMNDLKQMLKDLEMASSELAERASQMDANGSRVMVIEKSKHKHSENAGLTRRVFTITNHTSDLDLEAFNQQATAAGIDVAYSCKVWSSKIRSLDMQLSLNTNEGHQTTELEIKKIKRNESYAYNIIWYENANGEAVRLSTGQSDCSDAQHHNNCSDD